MAGTPGDPVGLDSFRNIVNVHWPARWVSFRVLFSGAAIGSGVEENCTAEETITGDGVISRFYLASVTKSLAFDAAVRFWPGKDPVANPPEPVALPDHTTPTIPTLASPVAVSPWTYADTDPDGDIVIFYHDTPGPTFRVFSGASIGPDGLGFVATTIATFGADGHAFTEGPLCAATEEGNPAQRVLAALVPDGAARVEIGMEAVSFADSRIEVTRDGETREWAPVGLRKLDGSHIEVLCEKVPPSPGS